jgi:hypothetical protein
MSDGTLQRDDVAMKMLAAWMNVRVDQMPPENNSHLNASTMAAWGRVAEAAAEHERAKIVAYLRYYGMLRNIANKIEAGEHLK